MKIKAALFMAIGAGAIYYGSNVELVDNSDLQIKKNYFTSAYTMNMKAEGMVMTFDKRYERELAPTVDTIVVLEKAAKTDGPFDPGSIAKLRAKLNGEVQDTMQKSFKIQ